jgi:hypothetical protein
MTSVWRRNGLSIVMFGLFLIFLFGQAWAGYRHDLQERREHGQRELEYGEYLTSGDFIEALAENWESEFLQMGLFVLLTAFLYQKGSAESNRLPEEGSSEAKSSKKRASKKVPWPVRKGGVMQKLYEHSLSSSLLLLFLISFALHAWGGRLKYNEEQIIHHQPPVSVIEYLGSSRFWFESFQNWQSEFLSVGVLVVFSIFLREKGSSQSKEMESPHSETEE